MTELYDILKHGPWRDRLKLFSLFLLLLSGWLAQAVMAWWLGVKE